MVKYIWPKEGQSFAEAIEAAKPKKRGRPLGSKNPVGHKEGRPKKYIDIPQFIFTSATNTTLI